MNLTEQLMLEMSRRNASYIAQQIGNDPKLFKEIIEIMFTAKAPLPLRASWVVTFFIDEHPELLKPYLNKIVGHLEKFDHSGIRRNLLNYFCDCDIPQSLEGKLYDICFRLLLSRDEPVAVKAYSMQVLFNIAQKEPDLKGELRLVLEDFIDHDSAAVKSRSRKLLAKL